LLETANDEAVLHIMQDRNTRIAHKFSLELGIFGPAYPCTGFLRNVG